MYKKQNKYSYELTVLVNILAFFCMRLVTPIREVQKFPCDSFNTAHPCNGVIIPDFVMNKTHWTRKSKSKLEIPTK